MFGMHFGAVAPKIQTNHNQASERYTLLRGHLFEPSGLISKPTINASLSVSFPRRANPGAAGGVGHSTGPSLLSSEII